MKKLESKLFENFKENQVNQLDKVVGGDVNTCIDNCSDTASLDVETGKKDDLTFDGGDCEL